jgi:hypothetical protein
MGVWIGDVGFWIDSEELWDTFGDRTGENTDYTIQDTEALHSAARIAMMSHSGNPSQFSLKEP